MYTHILYGRLCVKVLYAEADNWTGPPSEGKASPFPCHASVRPCIYANTCIYIDMLMYIHTRLDGPTAGGECVPAPSPRVGNVYIYHVCLCIHVCIRICIHICLHIYMFKLICIYMEIRCIQCTYI